MLRMAGTFRLHGVALSHRRLPQGTVLAIGRRDGNAIAMPCVIQIVLVSCRELRSSSQCASLYSTYVNRVELQCQLAMAVPYRPVYHVPAGRVGPVVRAARVRGSFNAK